MNDSIFNLEASWILLIFSALCNSLSTSIAKSRLNKLGKVELLPLRNFIGYLFTFLSSPITWIAIIIFMISPLLWFLALSSLKLNVAYPSAYALNILFIFLFSLLFLKEKITRQKVVGSMFLALAFYMFYAS